MLSNNELILLIDGGDRTLLLMKSMLERENYLVITASNGEEALAVFDEVTPDLVLIDTIMPVMDGYTACHRIREFSQVPIIMIADRDNDEEVVAELDAGADDCLVKPFSFEELIAVVKAVLHRCKTRVNSPEQKFHYYGLVELCSVPNYSAHTATRPAINQLQFTIPCNTLSQSCNCN